MTVGFIITIKYASVDSTIDKNAIILLLKVLFI